jgi:TPP-dependent indolepyruvate ferredoxin oxidoreductase alpha subunit
MIVKNLPRILLQQNTKTKKTRRRRRRRRRRKRTRNWVTLRIGCPQCRSCEICKDFHCKKISLQERKKKKKKKKKKRRRRRT